MAVAEEKRFVDIMNGLGESSSLHGLSKVITSRHIVVKLLWGLLLIGAVALFTFHLYALVEEYTSYPTKTSVTLKYAPLRFPALTFCNMNPVRLTAVIDDEQLSDIRNILEAAHFDDVIDDYLDELNEDLGTDFETSDLAREELLPEFRRFGQSMDTYMAWQIRLMIKLSELDETERLKAGHHLIDFIQRATYEGHRLPFEMFQTTSTIKFGNCFTLDSDDIIARGSGYTNSLHFVFNVDAFEYLHEVSSAYGVRMVLHEKGTHPLPDSEGITLSTKYETHIGIRMTKLNRLGGMYGSCSDGETFTRKYGIKYTVPVCYGVCESEQVLKVCDCVPLSSEIALQHSSNVCDLDNATEWECVENIKYSIKKGQTTCDCRNPCNEMIYSTTLSGRRWPHLTYLENVLLKETCRRLNDTSNNFTVSVEFEDICESFTEFLDCDFCWQKLADHFLSVYIYYEDLNYEDITEEPLYNTERFLSDIGGALGLYLGASLLTWVELIQVILEIVLHLKRKWRRVTPGDN